MKKRIVIVLLSILFLFSNPVFSKSTSEDDKKEISDSYESFYDFKNLGFIAGLGFIGGGIYKIYEHFLVPKHKPKVKAATSPYFSDSAKDLRNKFDDPFQGRILFPPGDSSEALTVIPEMKELRKFKREKPIYLISSTGVYFTFNAQEIQEMSSQLPELFERIEALDPDTESLYVSDFSNIALYILRLVLRKDTYLLDQMLQDLSERAFTQFERREAPYFGFFIMEKILKEKEGRLQIKKLRNKLHEKSAVESLEKEFEDHVIVDVDIRGMKR